MEPQDKEPIPVTDEAIIAEVLSGRRESFARLVDRYRDRIYRFLLCRCCSPEEAEDLAQEVFIAAYRALPRFRREAKFSTWLFGIALNRARNLARASRRKRHCLLSDSIVWKQALDRFHTDRPVIARVRQLLREIDSLPENLREPLIMAAFDDRSYREIAELLALPVGTVRSRIFRAREKLKSVRRGKE